ncbi:MAG: hypothetical protein CBC80_003510 [Flavobacteriaceae bacterium TMED120]|nr:MAG: hypothetical protein CBC80_003510 [Flavobacteriaceae bacterium TMED120]
MTRECLQVAINLHAQGVRQTTGTYVLDPHRHHFFESDLRLQFLEKYPIHFFHIAQMQLGQGGINQLAAEQKK